MSPHTPEPWTLIEDHGPHIMGGGHFIGDRYVGGHCIARLIDSTEATPANARLMIAAPDLLAALEEIAQNVTEDMRLIAEYADKRDYIMAKSLARQTADAVAGRARAAIRKARGR